MRGAATERMMTFPDTLAILIWLMALSGHGAEAQAVGADGGARIGLASAAWGDVAGEDGPQLPRAPVSSLGP